jgi:hypothetical protein
MWITPPSDIHYGALPTSGLKISAMPPEIYQFNGIFLSMLLVNGVIFLALLLKTRS